MLSYFVCIYYLSSYYVRGRKLLNVRPYTFSVFYIPYTFCEKFTNIFLFVNIKFCPNKTRNKMLFKTFKNREQRYKNVLKIRNSWLFRHEHRLTRATLINGLHTDVKTMMCFVLKLKQSRTQLAYKAQSK